MADPRIHRIGAAEVRIYPDWMETVYLLRVPAAGNDDTESLKRATELGYDSTFAMSLDHELLHSIIAEQRGEPYSRVLLGVALRSSGGHKTDIISPAVSAEEEALVLDVQRWLRTNVLSRRLAESTLDREALAARLKEVTNAREKV